MDKWKKTAILSCPQLWITCGQIVIFYPHFHCGFLFLTYPQCMYNFISLVIHTADFIHHLFQMFFEMAVFVYFLPNLRAGVHDCRMIAAVEGCPDVGIRISCQFAAHIHGNLPRQGDVFGLFLAHEFFIIDVIVLTDVRRDFVNGDIFLFILGVGNVMDGVF